MKILIFYPVKESYTNLWEYYKNDKDIIKDISSKFYYSNNFFNFLISVFKVDYVYCWWWHTSILQIITAKILKKKVICTGAIHMFDYSGGKDTFFKKKFLYRIFCKISLYLADANLFLSNDQKNQIVSHIKVSNPHVVYSSLEKKHLETYSKIKEKKKYNNTINLVSTLWLTKSSIVRKGLYEILDALEILSNKNFIFYIIGKKGDGYDNLINKIKKLKIKNKIKILTDLPTLDKNKILESAELYLQPSHYEGLGNAVIEAMSKGCVPIVSRFASQPEVVSEFGYIVNEICKEDIAKKILKYLNLPNGRKIILKNKILDYTHKKFSYNLHLEKIKNIIKSLNQKNNKYT
jgi:glycosyltransferase involved in cell wall biosynthesis